MASTKTTKSAAAVPGHGPDTKIMVAQAALKINDKVKFKYRRGIIFHGLVKERLPNGNVLVKYESSTTPGTFFEAKVSPFILKAA